MKEYKLFLSGDRGGTEESINLAAKEGYTLHSIVPIGERSMLIAMERQALPDTFKTSPDNNKEEEFPYLRR
jgi:hypothetical protein